MNPDSSRRTFLRASLALPAAGLVEAFEPPAAIPYRTLGKTGLKVNPVGMGVGFTPDPSVVSRAVDLGVNFFDTANDYSGGNSERLLAQGLKGGLRQKVVLVSKTPASDRKTFFADLESSLKNLETDHVDIWLLHAKDKPAAAPDELIEAGAEARKQGKIRFFGLSTHDIDAMVDRAVQTKLDVVIISYSFAMGASRDAAIAKAQAAGIGLVAMKVMAATGGGMPPARPARLKNPLAALKWVLKNPSITVAIPGTRDADMLEMNLRALTEKLTPEDEKSLSARNEEIRPYYCRMCYRCTGQCPKGVPVPDQLRILAYADFYNDFPFARTNFQRLPEEVRAIRCQDCATCAVRCPNGVRVAERLIRAQEMLG